ncbi:MAG: phosphotransferase family protein [Pacificimonas sp.]
MSETETDESRLATLLTRETGAPVSVETLTPLSGGAASMSYAVNAVRDGEPLPLVMQRSAGEGDTVRTMSRAQQATLQQRVAKSGVSAPDVVAILQSEDGLGEGFVMPFVEGETLAPRYLRKPEFAKARDRLGGQTAASLAKLHALPTDMVDGLGLETVDGPKQLANLRDLYDVLNGAVPVFEMAFIHLSERLRKCREPVIVHGDFRSGNFIVGEDGLKSILDWELAHLGDPLLDIGWLATNTWRFGNWDKPMGGFSEREPFYTAYEEAGGHAIDRDQALAFEMLGSLRWGIMCLQMAAAHLSGDVPSVERAAIGRRVSETEADLLHIMRTGSV